MPYESNRPAKQRSVEHATFGMVASIVRFAAHFGLAALLWIGVSKPALAASSPLAPQPLSALKLGMHLHALAVSPDGFTIIFATHG